MKLYFGCLTAAALAASLQMVAGAEIGGKVKLKGTPKAEIQIPLDATCGAMHSGPVTTRFYVVGADNGLGNVFVYIKSGAAKTPVTGPAPVLDQVGCLYEPYVMGVGTDQTFKIRNSDAVFHNIHAMPKAEGNKEFNFAQPIKGQVSEKSFPKPEVLVRMKCDVHPWMFAYIGVCDHPYFAVTDKDGNFKISNVPAGKYTVEALHLKAGAKTVEITVGADDKKTADFELEVPAAP